MLEAIYAVLSLMVLILAAIFYLILRRWITNLLGCYVERRKLHFVPHVLKLLDDVTETEPLQRGLLPGDRKFIKELLLQQAVHLKGQDRRNMTMVFEKNGYVKSEINALHSRRWWRRLEAATSLGIMQSNTAVSALIDVVRDPSEDVRLAAVRALGQLHEPRVLRALLNAIEEGTLHTGSSIAEVLVGMGPESAPEITREIIARLESITNIDSRVLYIRLCGLLRSTTALNFILRLVRDPDKEIRISAVRALGQIGDIAAVESLIFLLDDESWEVRAQAAKALGSLGDNQAAGKLKRALSDENWWVRHNAADALYRLGAESIKTLSEASS